MIRMRRRIRYCQKNSSNTSTSRANQWSISRRTSRSTSRWPRRSRTAWMTTSLISWVAERSSKLLRSSSKSTTKGRRVSPLSRWWTRGLRRDHRAISHRWVRGKAIRSLRSGTYSTRHRAIWFIRIPRNLWPSTLRVKGLWWRNERWLIHFGLHSLSRKKGSWKVLLASFKTLSTPAREESTSLIWTTLPKSACIKLLGVWWTWSLKGLLILQRLSRFLV